MHRKKYYYLVRVQYLGFRFSGWQKQPQHKTVEGMLTKTLKFILPDSKFKILGAGRTDAKVSALDMAFELFLFDDPLKDMDGFIRDFNTNLPSDIRVVGLEEVNQEFNIIKDSRQKEYVYLFSFGEKNHPYCAPFLANIIDDLDIDLMIKCAELFVGTHDFSAYTARLQSNTKVVRTIDSCQIKINTILKANFFPETSYALHICGAGFMRYQIRMIMGALIQVGKGELLVSDIKESLLNTSTTTLTYVAPGSGLMLNKLDFD
ncbi:tRNA pseudouridine synthase A [Arenibacter antarcticus]|uniref:tRNA pseudouridine synthase A n=1 Tax=Arenibacter antarcticus TaxID=2040469 RepID=A0ABW5VIK9_9FLAO|nr:tRNA pseudouridine(38-40) synthase TruA [Arenibacter sp. H213]MCM4166255.1 tRNA pseudouridine(38-40) synthase TruA [Arenibacter sp. H213]